MRTFSGQNLVSFHLSNKLEWRLCRRTSLETWFSLQFYEHSKLFSVTRLTSVHSGKFFPITFVYCHTNMAQILWKMPKVPKENLLQFMEKWFRISEEDRIHNSTSGSGKLPFRCSTDPDSEICLDIKKAFLYYHRPFKLGCYCIFQNKLQTNKI